MHLASLAPVALVAAVVAIGWTVARVFGWAGGTPMLLIATTGIVAGAVTPAGVQPQLGPAFLYVFLPVLIFEAAWGGDIHALRRAALPIAMLAGPGTIITAFIVCAAAMGFGGIPLAAAAVLGSLVAATDPVTVLATFRSLRLPPVLITIVEGESIANDAVALVLVQALVPLALLAAPHPNVAMLTLRMLAASGLGAVVGAAFGLLAGLTLGRARIAALQFAICALAAFGAYELAAACGASGVFAVATAGIVARLRANIPEAAQSNVDAAWQAAAFICNAIVFALIGLTLRIDRLFHEPLLLASVVVAIVFARLVLAYGVVPLRGLTRDPWRWKNVIALAGLRGGLSLALTIGLPAALPMRSEIRDAVFAVVFATLVVQGNVIPLALRRFGLGEH
jgi:Na+:H+ antiporter